MPSTVRPRRYRVTLVLTALIVGLAVSVGIAFGAQGWQASQTLPAGETPVGVNRTGPPEIGGGMFLDASGNAFFLAYQNGTPSFVLRAKGATAGTPAPLPTPVGEFSSPTMAADAAGDAFVFDGYAPDYAYRAAGAGALGPAVSTPGFTITSIAVAPTGEALAIGYGVDNSGNHTTSVAFRPAGAATTFDLANKILLPPAAGDTDTEPVGITMDADGAATAVYRSYNGSSTSSYLQTSRPADSPNFGQPTQIQIPANNLQFAKSTDGTAILGAFDPGNTQVLASVRPPGGQFGPVTTVATAPAGGEVVGLSLSLAAGDSGHAMAGWTQDPGSAGSTCMNGPDASFAWGLSSFDSAHWSTPLSGPLNWPDRSRAGQLVMTGSQYAFVTEEQVDTAGTRCNNDDDVSRLAVLTGTTSTAPVSSPTLASDLVGGNPPQADQVAVDANGDVLLAYGAALQSTPHSLVAFEDPSTSTTTTTTSASTSTTTSSSTSTSPSSGSTTTTTSSSTTRTPQPAPTPRPTQPTGIVLTGRIITVPSSYVMPFTVGCGAPEECAYNIAIFAAHGAHLTAVRRTATLPITLATAHGRLRAHSRKVVRLSLRPVARKALAKRHTLQVTLRVKISVAGHASTKTYRRTLRLRPARRRR